MRKISWLHVSDFHIRGGDPYDRDVVLRALVASVRELRGEGLAPDLIFATGDIAFSGKVAEYEVATAFFDALATAAGLERRRLFVIPGNHDVDREQGVGLARTLDSRERADAYFRPGLPKPHLTQKLGAFRAWHDGYFAGIRSLPEASTCGPVEVVELPGGRIAVLPIDSALFCEDDQDHAKLLVGRRCLDPALAELSPLPADLKVALIHHPLDWLSDVERSNVKASLQREIDVVLRGHLHETEVESVVSASGGALHVAAGAAYQTRKWPNRALYATFEDRHLEVYPIRYEDTPTEIWTVDPSVFPRDPGNRRRFPLPRLSSTGNAVSPKATDPLEPRVAPRFRSNIPSLGDLPFVGRDSLLTEIAETLGDPSRERALVLHGPPGVGKSELAREYCRRNQERYPSGTFFLATGGGGELVELARIGANVLDLRFPSDLSLKDQCERTLLSLGSAPALLIYDNVPSLAAVEPWLLPRSGMPCHMLITSLNERWDGWPVLEVPPLPSATALDLVERLAGRAVAERHGASLVKLADGLPIQLVPAARTLAYEERRGRLDSAEIRLSREAQDSFHLVYRSLDSSVRLLLHAAAVLSTQRIVRRELFHPLTAAGLGGEADLERVLDVGRDLHLLEGEAELRMHQLFAAFLLELPIAEELAAPLEGIRRAQRARLVELGRQVESRPADRELAAALLTYPLSPSSRLLPQELSLKDGNSVGRALTGIGRFEEARPWFERSVEAKEKGEALSRVEHPSLGSSLHQVGYCLSSVGKYEEARVWYERAVEVKEKGEDLGRVDHPNLGSSLHQVGFCLSSVGKYREARAWYERAVKAKEKGDGHGRINHESLGRSLHQVGFCLSSVGKYEEARSWYERAVGAHDQGDVHGRIDHTELGKSVYCVGFCLSSVGKYEEARSWYERAVEAHDQGDVHSRVDHTELGKSLHQVGICLSNMEKLEEALSWYERAVEAKQKGDIFGRIDRDSLSLSEKELARCRQKL